MLSVDISMRCIDACKYASLLPVPALTVSWSKRNMPQNSIALFTLLKLFFHTDLVYDIQEILRQART